MYESAGTIEDARAVGGVRTSRRRRGARRRRADALRADAERAERDRRRRPQATRARRSRARAAAATTWPSWKNRAPERARVGADDAIRGPTLRRRRHRDRLGRRRDCARCFGGEGGRDARGCSTPRRAPLLEGDRRRRVATGVSASSRRTRARRRRPARPRGGFSPRSIESRMLSSTVTPRRRRFARFRRRFVDASVAPRPTPLVDVRPRRRAPSPSTAARARHAPSPLRFPSTSRTSRTPSSPRLWRRASCHFREPPRRRARPLERRSRALPRARATRHRRDAFPGVGRLRSRAPDAEGSPPDRTRRARRPTTASRDRPIRTTVGSGTRPYSEDTSTAAPGRRRDADARTDRGEEDATPPRGDERVEGDAANLDDVSFVPVVPPTRVRVAAPGPFKQGILVLGAPVTAPPGVGRRSRWRRGSIRSAEDPLARGAANGGMTSTRRRREEGCGADERDEREGREGRIGGTREWSERRRFARRRAAAERPPRARPARLAPCNNNCSRKNVSTEATRQLAAERSLSAAVSTTIRTSPRALPRTLPRARVVASAVDRLGEDRGEADAAGIDAGDASASAGEAPRRSASSGRGSASAFARRGGRPRARDAADEGAPQAQASASAVQRWHGAESSDASHRARRRGASGDALLATCDKWRDRVLHIHASAAWNSLGRLAADDREWWRREPDALESRAPSRVPPPSASPRTWARVANCQRPARRRQEWRVPPPSRPSQRAEFQRVPRAQTPR